jgi:hypothetical protein
MPEWIQNRIKNSEEYIVRTQKSENPPPAEHDAPQPDAVEEGPVPF